MRFPTKAAIEKFSDIFELKIDPRMQDWEIEYSDPKRVHEFIHYYMNNALSDDEKFTLMALILGSFEEYHDLNEPEARTWKTIKKILENDIDIHLTHIQYYRYDETKKAESCFPITKLMRQIEIKKDIKPL